MPKPIVVIVGRPNVGNSTLFNRITKSYAAIIEDIPGVTRDRNYLDAEWDDRHFIVRRRVAPPIDQVARGPRGLRRGDAVVDDPDLTQCRDAQCDLVEPGVMGDCVDVQEVRLELLCRRVRGYVAERLQLLELCGVDLRCVRAGVQIEALGVRSRIAMVRRRRVVALDQVIPNVPLPDNQPTDGHQRPNLDDLLRPKLSLLQQGRGSGRLQMNSRSIQETSTRWRTLLDNCFSLSMILVLPLLALDLIRRTAAERTAYGVSQDDNITSGKTFLAVNVEFTCE